MNEPELELKIGCCRYDLVEALFDGSVRIDGADTRMHTADLASDLFERMIRNREFGVAELGLSFYLRTLELPDPPFIALPVFPARAFRHSAIYVNTTAGIREPADLAGKLIGEFGMYGHDAGVTAKGFLADDFGVTPQRCRWVVGGFDWPMAPFDYVPQLHPDGVQISRVRADQALGPMLDTGEIDALISADVPECVRNGSPRVAPLFPDAGAVERDYHDRTGIFPIMHTLVIRRELAAAHPGLARHVYRGFTEAREAALAGYRTGRIINQIRTNVPWLSELVEANRHRFGGDGWPYGIAANRTALDAFFRWHHEQGLSSRQFGCADVFLPELLGT
jgi:hypothetical protein